MITTIPNAQINENAHVTMSIILSGSRGGEFQNGEGRLPYEDNNGNPITYRVVGSNGAYYYTDTHYGTNYNTNFGIPFFRAGTLPQSVTNTIFGGQK